MAQRAYKVPAHTIYVIPKDTFKRDYYVVPSRLNPLDPFDVEITHRKTGTQYKIAAFWPRDVVSDTGSTTHVPLVVA